MGKRACARVFRSGNSQAVRLPKEIAYADGTELEMVRSGDVTILCPAHMSLAEIVRRLKDMPRPGQVEERNLDELPEPAGL